MPVSLVNGGSAWLCQACNVAHPIDRERCACGQRRDDLEDRPEDAADVRMLPVDQIRPSSDNPRRRFDTEALERLAQSIKQHGVLQPILVYHGPEGLEIVGGERRWRASRMAGVSEIPARLLDITDEEAVELRGIENLQREQLDPIEEALWLRQMLDRCGFTQAALARRLGWGNQSQVAERIALLKLPQDWQERIIAGEIPPSHARRLMAWRDRPQVLERVARLLSEWRERKGGTPSAAAFASLVCKAAHACSRPMTRRMWASESCLFEPTDEQREELDIQHVPSPYPGGEAEPRAFNVALWTRLQRQAKEAAREERSAGDDAPAGDAAAGEARPAEQRGPHEWQVRPRLVDWYGREIARRLTGRHRDLALRIVLLLGADDEMLAHAVGLDPEASEDAIRTMILTCERKMLDRAWVDMAKRAVTTPCFLRLEYLRSIARHMEIDVATDWRPSREDLELYDRDELVTWPTSTYEEPPDDLYDGMDRDQVITSLLDDWRDGYVPDEYMRVASNV